jgi:hypothetical protein
MFDGGRVRSPGVRQIDDINAAKEMQYGKSGNRAGVGFETAMKMLQSEVLDLI